MASRLKVDELAGSGGYHYSGLKSNIGHIKWNLTLGSDTSVTNAQLSNSSITIGDESSNVFDISLGDEVKYYRWRRCRYNYYGNLVTIAVRVKQAYI